MHVSVKERKSASGSCQMSTLMQRRATYAPPHAFLYVHHTLLACMYLGGDASLSLSVCVCAYLEMTKLPSGLKTTSDTDAWWPANVRRTAPVRTSASRTSLS
jgi:hypothetical protein